MFVAVDLRINNLKPVSLRIMQHLLKNRIIVFYKYLYQ